jgi:hypothetical protein
MCSHKILLIENSAIIIHGLLVLLQKRHSCLFGIFTLLVSILNLFMLFAYLSYQTSQTQILLHTAGACKFVTNYSMFDKKVYSIHLINYTYTPMRITGNILL